MFFTRNVADARKRLDGLKNQQLRSRQVALYKLLEAAALVAEMLSLPVALDGSGVSLAIALAGNRDARLATSCGFRERPGRRGDRNEFFAGDNPAVVNADRRAGNLLLGMVRGRLKNSPATTATTQTHQATPDQNVLRSFCPEVAFNLKPPTKNSAHIESHAEFLPPPRGWGHCSSDCQDCCSFSLPRTDGKEQAEKLAGNNGNDANSSGRLRIRMGFAHSLRKPRSTRKHRSKIQSL